MTQDLVGAPFLAEFDRRSFEVAMILFEFAFEPRQERKSVGGSSRKTRKNTIVIKPADLFWRWIS